MYSYQDPLIFPSTINGYPVTDIGEGAFFLWSGTSVTIPDSVVNIQEGAFSNCRSLTNVIIGNGVINIGDYAFEDCYALTSVTIGNSVANIQEGAFSNCRDITRLVIPDMVINIGEYAFYACNSLTNVMIPKNVTSIGSEAFLCANLANITVASDNLEYSSADGVLFNRLYGLLCFGLFWGKKAA